MNPSKINLGFNLSSSANELLESINYKKVIPKNFELQNIIETHISVVLLGKTEVIKFKKAVDFGFINHLELKHRFESCISEVVLNRRLSSNIYKGVVVIKKTGSDLGQMELIESPEQYEPKHSDLDLSVIEAGVLMRRLDESNSLHYMLAHNELNPKEHLLPVANKIASFHKAQIKSEKNKLLFSEIESRILDNFREIDKFEDYLIPLPTKYALEKVYQYTKTFLEDNRELLEERIDNGFVIDGHGDLRTDHIYFEENEVQVIDCIEFSQSLRTDDVLSDIGFLRVSLEYEGRPDLAEFLVCQYLKALNIIEQKKLLDFFSVYRAMVRAKVSLLSIPKEQEISLENSKIKEMARYVSIAYRHSLGLTMPTLFVVGGLMGVGKSTFASFLGESLGLKVLQTDRLRKDLFGSDRKDKDLAYKEGKYSKKASEKTYELLLEQAKKELCEGRSVILDASFSKAINRKQAKELAGKFGARAVMLLCSLEEDLQKARLKLRSKNEPDSISDGRLELQEVQKKSFEYPFVIEGATNLEVNMALETTEQMDKVVEVLG